MRRGRLQVGNRGLLDLALLTERDAEDLRDLAAAVRSPQSVAGAQHERPRLTVAEDRVVVVRAVENRESKRIGSAVVHLSLAAENAAFATTLRNTMLVGTITGAAVLGLLVLLVRRQILGPLEVLVADQPLAMGSAKQRAVLAMLALRLNEVVSIGVLVDGLWDQANPSGGQRVFFGQLERDGQGIHITAAWGNHVLDGHITAQGVFWHLDGQVVEPNGAGPGHVEHGRQMRLWNFR